MIHNTATITVGDRNDKRRGGCGLYFLTLVQPSASGSCFSGRGRLACFPPSPLPASPLPAASPPRRQGSPRGLGPPRLSSSSPRLEKKFL